MRDETNLEKLTQFMIDLAGRVRGEARIYLTGGATALLEGWRTMTIDIDLKADPEPRGFFEAIALLKETNNINVELASPDDFIPELPGWRERCLFIKRHKQLDYFHYDPYSQALSKLERAHARDLLDVSQMADRGLIQPERLWELFESIAPRLIRFPAIEPASFRASVQAFCEQSKP